jgi:hypothetical protein
MREEDIELMKIPDTTASSVRVSTVKATPLSIENKIDLPKLDFDISSSISKETLPT